MDDVHVGADGRSLLEDVRRSTTRPIARWGRRAGLTALLLVVLLGAFGFLGVRTGAQSASSQGYTLEVVYPKVARAGLDVQWTARVHRADRNLDDVTLAITTDYFRMFETQGFYPDASDSTNDGQFVYFTFSKPPAGHDFVLDFDAYIQPSSQIGKSAEVKLIMGGQEITSTTIRTVLMP